MNLDEAQKEMVMQLNQLDEIRQQAVQHTLLIQQQRETWHDKFIKENNSK